MEKKKGEGGKKRELNQGFAGKTELEVERRDLGWEIINRGREKGIRRGEGKRERKKERNKERGKEKGKGKEKGI